MTNDLVAALREAREFVRKRYLAMGDKEANELIAHIDAALSAAAGEASGACTCHPDDNPPHPCPQKYAYSECVAASRPAPSEAPKAKP